MRTFHSIRHAVFWPSCILLLFSVGLSVVYPDVFMETVTRINNWILKNFDWLFSWGTLFFLLIVIIVYFSPLGKVKLGGKDATPLLSKWRWFAITLCTTIATGILFWGAAEPIYHFNGPPEGSGLTPGSDDTAVFAMSTMFLHWTFTPYGMYTLAALTFAICYYNYKRPFSLDSALYPLIKGSNSTISTLANNICIFALIAGMAASLGAGVLTLSGGLESIAGIPQSDFLNLIICAVIVIVFIISASSGLQKGIRVLSNYNIIAFILLALFVFFFGPIGEMLRLGWSGAVDYVLNFFPRSTNVGSEISNEWQHGWTIFYWANWLAWTPVTAMFLGKIGRGYTVREFIRVNLLYTSIFGAFWMIIFSGGALAIDNATGGTLNAVLQSQGPQSVIYSVINTLPAPQIVSSAFLLVAFLSYVTAADSNTSALSEISTKGSSAEQDVTSTSIKIIWGIIIGAVAFTMITFAGIDGIKIISTIGGFPALFLVVAMAIALLKLAFTKIKEP